ncbi:SHUGOSHIN 2 [Bienertia sinuspersici]
MKSEKMIKTSSSLGSRMRKRLSDITNLNSQHKSPFKNQENALPVANDSSTRNYIDQILKENTTMMKLVEEKDKIIESKGLELQMLKVKLQRTQLQNYQLAQTNSHMLAELNMVKDRFKTLQHEFICKDALFKAMAVEIKEGKTQPEIKLETKPEEPAVEQQPLGNTKEGNKVSKVDKKVSKTKRERTARSQSMGPTTSTSQQAVDKEIMENKRRCLRRQSVRPSEKQQDNLFEIDVANNPVKRTMDSNVHRKSSSDVSDDEDCLSQSSKHAEAQRSSVGRPQRRATEKVQSYKDPPLNTKMRRPV